MGSLSLLQGIFPTWESNPGLPHCRQILYQLSHNRSPRILEWVAYPFSIRSSWSINPVLQADSLPTELSGKPKKWKKKKKIAQSCNTLCNPLDCSLPGSSWSMQNPWHFPGKSTEVGCYFLLQGILPTRGLNPHLPHYGQTLHPLRHQGKPELLRLLLHSSVRLG